MQRPTTPEWSKARLGERTRKISIDSTTSFLSPPLWGEAITHKYHAKNSERSFSSSPFGSSDNFSEQQQQTQQQRSQFHLDLSTTHNQARKVKSDEAVPKDKYDRLKLKSGSAFAQSSALLNSASAMHLDNGTKEDELKLRYDRLKVRGARIQQKVHSGTSYSSTSSSFSICSEGSVCNLAYCPENPRQVERGREGHRMPPSQSHLQGQLAPYVNNAFLHTEQGMTVVHATPPEFNNDLCVIVTPPQQQQQHPMHAMPRGAGDRPRPRSPKMNVSASTSNIPVLLEAQDRITKNSSGSQPLMLGEMLETDLAKTPAVPFITPPIKMRCDHSGGIYTVDDHDIQLKVPRGAIKKRVTADIQIGVCLHGPFAFPPNTQPVSPMIWLHIGPDVKLAKPVEIKIPHCLQFRAGEALPPSKMQFLRASCKPRTASRGQLQNYQLSEIDSKGSFTLEESSGTLATKQSSFVCITANDTPATVSQTSYCLIPVLPRPINCSTWKIQCCVTYFLKTCIQVSNYAHQSSSPIHNAKSTRQCKSNLRTTMKYSLSTSSTSLGTAHMQASVWTSRGA